MLFITAQQLPSFITWDGDDASPRRSRHRRRQSWLRLPRLKPRQVPITQWLLQVTTFASGTLMNNLVYAYSVPLTIQIVFRSAGLAVSMFIGRVFMGKRYTLQQIVALAVVSSGVIIATLSRPRAGPAPPTTTTTTNHTSTTGASTAAPAPTAHTDALRGTYALGIAMLVASLICTGVHGALQERTYNKYGPHWREGIFYTHMLSLPMFAFMPTSVRRGFAGLSRPTRSYHGVELGDDAVKNSMSLTSETGTGIHPYTILALNLITQLICVSGVNQLSSRVSAVSTQVVLTARKAISLCFSVWWFGSGWNAQLAGGALMVFVGSFWYSLLPAPARPRPTTTQGRRGKRS